MVAGMCAAGAILICIRVSQTPPLTPLPFFRRRFLSAAGAGATACQSAAERLLRAGLAGGAALPLALPPAAGCIAAPGVGVILRAFVRGTRAALRSVAVLRMLAAVPWEASMRFRKASNSRDCTMPVH